MKQIKKDEHEHVHLGINTSLIVSTVIGTLVLTTVGNNTSMLMGLNLYCSLLLVVDKIINNE